MRYIIFFAILFIPALTVYATGDYSSWETKRDINIPEIANAEYVYVPLPADSSIGRFNFRDLRVVNDLGKEIPYQLLVEDEERNRTVQSPSISDLSTNADGSVMFIIEVEKDDELHNSLNIIFESAEFRRNVSVYASDVRHPLTDERWRLLTNEGYVFSFLDKRAGVHIEGNHIRYPESSAKYLRIVVDSGEGDLLNVRSVSLEQHSVREAVETEIYRNTTITNNEKERTTEVVIDMQRNSIPIQNIELKIQDAVFHRDVVIQRSSDGVRWRTVSRDSIFRIDTPAFSGERLNLSFHEFSDQYLRLVIFNYDNPPLTIENNVVLKSVARAIIFQANSGDEYQLLYGNSKAKETRYDITRFFHYLDLSDILKAELAESEINPYYKTPVEKDPPFTERYGFLLNLILIVVVVISAIIVYFTILHPRHRKEVLDNNSTDTE